MRLPQTIKRTATALNGDDQRVTHTMENIKILKILKSVEKYVCDVPPKTKGIFIYFLMFSKTMKKYSCDFSKNDFGTC